MKQSRGTDLATVGGLIIAAMGLFLGLRLEGIEIADVGQATAALIVLCGTAGAVLISMPLTQTTRALQMLPAMFRNPVERETEVIEEIVRYARAARIRGLLSLERETEKIADPFFRRGMRMAVDSVGTETIESVLDFDISGLKTQAESAAVFYETAAGYAPTLGVAGAALGLVQVMKHIEHVEQVGMGVAAAFVATIYGVLLANLVFLPIATKIRARAESRVRICGILREGVLSIATGVNPALIRLKLGALAQIHEEKPSRSALRAMSA
jgi:chemotaxis protein MotA